MWLALAIALGVVTVGVGLVLVTPLDVDVRADRRNELCVRLRVAWLYGLLSKDIDPLAASPAPSDDDDGDRRRARAEESKPSRRRKERRPARGFSRALAAVQAEGFVSAILVLLRRLVRGFEVRALELWARAGFDDPADTGRAAGVVLPVAAYLRWATPYRIDVEPDFSGEALVFRFEGAVRLVPIRFVWPLFAFALSPGAWRALYAAARA